VGVCLFQQGRRVLKAVAPAAGSCGPQPCWTGSGTDFDYVDPDGTPDGIRRIVIGSDGLKAAARGNELATSAQGLPDPLFSGSPGPAILAQVHASNDACLEATFDSLRSVTSRRFFSRND
jgi:hypothetical protein